MTKPSVILAKAKRIIETKGWCQHQYHEEGDGYCMIGAEILVTPDRDDLPTEYLSRVIHSSVISWNDAPGRTKKQVLAAFDKAIRLAKEAGE